MSAPEITAAQRLGVLPQYIDSMTVPEEALAQPKDYVLINDGRDMHGDAIVVWLAKVTTKGRAEIVRMVARLPRRGPSRPALFVHAEASGVEKFLLDREGLREGITKRARADVGTREDLTGVELKLVISAK